MHATCSDVLSLAHNCATRATRACSTPHNRSFQGFTCLLQLSTRSADWLVDTLALRPLIGPALAGLFADPCVVKVLHGADKDILWLQVGGPGGAGGEAVPSSCLRGQIAD